MNNIIDIELEWSLMDIEFKEKYLETLADKALYTADINDHIILAYYYNLDKIKYGKNKWFFLSSDNKWYITNTDKIRMNITSHQILLKKRKEFYRELMNNINNIELKRYYARFAFSPIMCFYDDKCKSAFFSPYITKMMKGVKAKFCSLEIEKILYENKMKEIFTIEYKNNSGNIKLSLQE